MSEYLSKKDARLVFVVTSLQFRVFITPLQIFTKEREIGKDKEKKKRRPCPHGKANETATKNECISRADDHQEVVVQG